MFIRYLLYAFLLYLLYRFIAGFVYPVFITARQMKKQFREMSERMNQPDSRNPIDDFMNHSSNTQSPENKSSYETSATNKETGAEYIDFEEVK
jgi:uncharacterized protein YneF (UPF0154 family)